jgi:hypothetical protein
MDDSFWIYLGGSLGVVLGLAGGYFGVRASLKNAKSAEERRLVWRFSAAVLAMIALLMAGLVLLPPPFNWLTWLPYTIVLVISIRYANRLQDELRQQAVQTKV